MRLIEVKPSLFLKVIGLNGDSVLVDRLEEMGLGIGRTLVLVRKTPLNGPLVVQAGNVFIALRHEEAECIEVAEK